MRSRIADMIRAGNLRRSVRAPVPRATRSVVPRTAFARRRPRRTRNVPRHGLLQLTRTASARSSTSVVALRIVSFTFGGCATAGAAPAHIAMSTTSAVGSVHVPRRAAWSRTMAGSHAAQRTSANDVRAAERGDDVVSATGGRRDLICGSMTGAERGRRHPAEPAEPSARLTPGQRRDDPGYSAATAKMKESLALLRVHTVRGLAGVALRQRQPRGSSLPSVLAPAILSAVVQLTLRARRSLMIRAWPRPAGLKSRSPQVPVYGRVGGGGGGGGGPSGWSESASTGSAP